MQSMHLQMQKNLNSIKGCEMSFAATYYVSTSEQTMR